MGAQQRSTCAVRISSRRACGFRISAWKNSSMANAAACPELRISWESANTSRRSFGTPATARHAPHPPHVTPNPSLLQSNPHPSCSVVNTPNIHSPHQALNSPTKQLRNPQQRHPNFATDNLFCRRQFAMWEINELSRAIFNLDHSSHIRSFVQPQP